MVWFRTYYKLFIGVIIVVSLLLAEIIHASSHLKTAPVYQIQIIHTYPHDSQAFTEGLFFYNGFLYESTGLNNESKLRKIDLATGKVLQQYDLASQYFGEGITTLNQRIYQLTYQSQIGFVYDLNFKLLKTFSYQGEGWGLASDDHYLIKSNGTAQLQFIDPQNFKVVREITVHDGAQAIDNLNELEYINGKIYANVWFANRIAIISPQTGLIEGWIDCSKLVALQHINDPNAVLNGIAYDSQNHYILVTGKLWPAIYAIRIIK